MVGNGDCRSSCNVIGDPCKINQFYKSSSNFDECKSACENEIACTGFDISWGKKYCTIYGNISSVNVDTWKNPDDWRHIYRFTFGYEGFKVNSSTGKWGASCFKRLDEGRNNDGKTFNYSLNLEQ